MAVLTWGVWWYQDILTGATSWVQPGLSSPSLLANTHTHTHTHRLRELVLTHLSAHLITCVRAHAASDTRLCCEAAPADLMLICARADAEMKGYDGSNLCRC
eukprot:270328-Rhodomonas_salina.4